MEALFKKLKKDQGRALLAHKGKDKTAEPDEAEPEIRVREADKDDWDEDRVSDDGKNMLHDSEADLTEGEEVEAGKALEEVLKETNTAQQIERRLTMNFQQIIAKYENEGPRNNDEIIDMGEDAYVPPEEDDNLICRWVVDEARGTHFFEPPPDTHMSQTFLSNLTPKAYCELIRSSKVQEKWFKEIPMGPSGYDADNEAVEAGGGDSDSDENVGHDDARVETPNGDLVRHLKRSKNIVQRSPYRRLKAGTAFTQDWSNPKKWRTLRKAELLAQGLAEEKLWWYDVDTDEDVFKERERAAMAEERARNRRRMRFEAKKNAMVDSDDDVKQERTEEGDGVDKGIQDFDGGDGLGGEGQGEGVASGDGDVEMGGV
ncbi:hypothetical protein LTR17_011877 [Elasticomyces elasticus]|nr:hypothetical protein LTR17_011877 [Elasticomyces elasticus]